MKINFVIPAAGAATRLKPLSNNSSKAMVRVNGRPCIDYILSEICKYDVGEIVIVDGVFNDIREYVEKSKFKDVKFVKQGSLNGPRDAIKKGLSVLDDSTRPLVVWLGDAIIVNETYPMGDDFLLTKQVVDQSPWCIWDGTKFYDKPLETIIGGHALVGLYSFKNGVLAKELFDNSDDYNISAALSLYAEHSNFKNIITNSWYDIGDITTYHKTCAELLNHKARSFNSFTYDRNTNTITKYPDWSNYQAVKAIEYENEWYKNITDEQRMFVPKYIKGETTLKLSWETGTLLSDLLLYDDIPETTWDHILSKLFMIMNRYFHVQDNIDREFIKHFDSRTSEMWIGKTKERFEYSSIDIVYSSDIIAIAKNVRRKSMPVSTMHGDLHFGNILYNMYNDHIIFIDPRGSFGISHSGTNGDSLYDWSKLAHDLYWNYSGIVANREQKPFIKDLFLKYCREYNLPVNDIIAGGLVLVATAIPLHSDDVNRQKRLSNVVENNIEYVKSFYSL